MIEIIVGIVFGGVISWAITHRYHRKSTISCPEWAEPLLAKLPEIAPTGEELIKLFQQEINSGSISTHPVFDLIACPNCYAPLHDLKQKVLGDDNHTLLDISCPQCGEGKVRRLLPRIGVIYKGRGYYTTDYSCKRKKTKESGDTTISTSTAKE